MTASTDILAREPRSRRIEQDLHDVLQGSSPVWLRRIAEDAIAALKETERELRALLTREAAPQEGRDERAAFEAWVRKRSPWLPDDWWDANGYCYGSYNDAQLNYAWEAWQAATKAGGNDGVR